MPNKKLTDPGIDNTIKNIIFDTDAGPDGDDTAALTMLYNYENMGKVKILATVSDTSSPYGAPYLSALNTYYGFSDIPVGTLKSKDYIMPTSRGNNFNIRLTADCENNIKDGTYAPDAVAIYRKVLSQADDNSVTILATGMQTNIADLLRSTADEYSALNGIELVEKKVKLISAMAGQWPNSKFAEFNVEQDIEAAQYVAKNCPVPVVYSGFSVGDGVVSGPLYNEIEEDSPLHIAWWDMNSWDQTSAIYAVEGLKDYWEIKCGDVIIDDDGINHFTENPDGMRYYLIEDQSKDKLIGEEITKLSNAPKKNNPNEKKVYSISASDTTLSDGFKVFSAEGPGWREGITEEERMYLHTYKNNLSVSSQKGAYITTVFKGTTIDIYGSKGVDNGSFEVIIDNKSYGIYDTKTDVQPKYLSQHICTISDLEDAEHEVKIQLTDDKHIGLDFIRVS